MQAISDFKSQIFRSAWEQMCEQLATLVQGADGIDQGYCHTQFL